MKVTVLMQYLTTPHATDHVSQCLPVAGVGGDGVMSSLCCTPLL